MRLHLKNRSQSAMSEPTRLSVPLEAMSSALNTDSPGMSFWDACGSSAFHRTPRKKSSFAGCHKSSTRNLRGPCGLDSPR